MNVLLFEDDRVGQLTPLTIGRPAYAISCGSYRLVERIGPSRQLIRPHLRPVEAANAPESVLAEGKLSRPTLFINARLVPSVSAIKQLQTLVEVDRECIVAQGDCVLSAVVKRAVELPAFGDGAALPALLRTMSLPSAALELPLFEYPHDVIRFHMQSLAENLNERARDQGRYREIRDGVFVGENVNVGDHLVTDTRGGPIMVDELATVGPFCYLAGPLYLGPGSKVNAHSQVKDGVTLGQQAKVGGEVEASIIEAFSNKQHHGFLGHSYIGSWVNLGAGTCNSDLKNTYGAVNMDYGGRKTQTGMQFLGCFVGDYSKTAVNTSIFTGKTIGACSMVYGFVTTNVPSFTNYARSFNQVTESPVAVAISTQARMFARRGIEQRPCDVQLLRDMYELTRGERTTYGEPMATEPLSL
jgi:UDP-N-acetylglucosamine diphosphorylase/glucosamine-1-phosphate N-acetyltransferase